MYNGYQQSDSAEKKQLVALHLQHRQGELNSMKRKELEAYMAELQKSPVRVSCHKDSSVWSNLLMQDFHLNFQKLHFFFDRDLSFGKIIKRAQWFGPILDYIDILENKSTV